MKKLKSIAIGVLFALCYLSSSAQETIPLNEGNYNKPQLFSDLPDRMNLDISTLQNLFTLPRGASVKQQLSEDFILKGVVVSKSEATSNSPVTTVVIRCTSRPGAVFTFTRVVGQDESITYRGRILSRNNSDALDIVKVNNQYYLQKKNYNDIISE